MSKTICILAGEASGDLLAAQLAYKLLTLNPELQLIGMGGQKMRDAGVNIIVDCEQLAVVGLLEIITHFSAIRAAIKIIKKLFKRHPPDLLICVDYPGFNLHMAKIAKKYGIKVLYYVSPQIWAWRYGRVNRIRRYVDRIAVLFAFEQKLYQKEHIPVSFVGHPLAEMVVPTRTKNELYQHYQLDPNKPVVTVMPGSRQQEITRMMPIINQALALIQQHTPDAQFVLLLAPTLTMNDLQPHLQNPIQVIKDDAYNIFSITTAAIVTSGTATLELALLQVPMAVVYKMSALSAFVAKRVINIPHISLCNIIAQSELAKEFIQDAALPSQIAAEIIKLIGDPAYRSTQAQALSLVKHNLGNHGAVQKIATTVMDML